jgi:hypothetical protein
MTIYISVFAGALLGGLVAGRRQGSIFDILQYMAIFAIIFGIIATFAVILAHR